MRADIGFAMGGIGSDAAIESADVVIMNDEPTNGSTVGSVYIINFGRILKKVLSL